jgi:hypothetical protein
MEAGQTDSSAESTSSGRKDVHSEVRFITGTVTNNLRRIRDGTFTREMFHYK